MARRCDAGGTKAFAFDAGTGDLVHEITIPGTFVNDVVVARDAL